jgi:hypothetical protein
MFIVIGQQDAETLFEIVFLQVTQCVFGFQAAEPF